MASQEELEQIAGYFERCLDYFPTPKADQGGAPRAPSRRGLGKRGGLGAEPRPKGRRARRKGASPGRA